MDSYGFIPSGELNYQADTCCFATNDTLGATKNLMNGSKGQPPSRLLSAGARAAFLLLIGLSSLSCSSCATLSPEEQADNSETRFQQEMLHLPDPAK
jgi:hypothetical protein